MKREKDELRAGVEWGLDNGFFFGVELSKFN